jgi:hypothetical protein
MSALTGHRGSMITAPGARKPRALSAGRHPISLANLMLTVFALALVLPFRTLTTWMIRAG